MKEFLNKKEIIEWQIIFSNDEKSILIKIVTKTFHDYYFCGYIKKDNCIYYISINNFEIDISVELNINRKIDECLRENDYINRILVLDFNFVNPSSIYFFSDYLIIKQEIKKQFLNFQFVINNEWLYCFK